MRTRAATVAAAVPAYEIHVLEVQLMIPILPTYTVTVLEATSHTAERRGGGGRRAVTNHSPSHERPEDCLCGGFVYLNIDNLYILHT